MQQDFYFALSTVIMASARDNPELRRKIYDLARSKLRRQLDWEAVQLGQTGKAQQLQALEIAINQIEADLARNIARHPNSRALALTTDAKIEIIPPSPRSHPQSELQDKPQYEPVPVEAARSHSSTIRMVLPLIATAILSVAAFVAVERGFYEDPQAEMQAGPAAPRVSKTGQPPPSLPIPASYGVYALSDGKLTGLEPLPVRLTDRGVAISGMLSSASTTKLPTGKSQFIAFRRDLVNNVPEKVTVRVVAQVMHGSVHDRAEEAMTNDANAWVIGNASYEMKVAPVDGKPAMIVIRPADADFSFPAGRYALVLKGVAYDFSVDGPISDLAQCVERTEELGSPVYTQCRKP